MPFSPGHPPDSAVVQRPAHLFKALASARRTLYKICLRCAHGDPAEADDLLAEASLRVVEASETTKDEIANPMSWWATIIRNIARDRHRQRVCRREQPEAFRIDDPTELSNSRALDGLGYVLARRELRRAFDAIARLPERQRRALLLRAMGTEYDEIAREVGTTYANTRKLVQVARRQLREIHEGAASLAS